MKKNYDHNVLFLPRNGKFTMQKKLPGSVGEAQKDLFVGALYFAHPRVQSNITGFWIPKLQGYKLYKRLNYMIIWLQRSQIPLIMTKNIRILFILF